MLSAAILNGGAATRFGGCDKGGVRIGGLTIRDRQLRELAQITDDILLIGHAPATAPASEYRVRVVPDRVPGCGPLAGLDAALTAAQHDTLVVIACDMPFVTARFLRYLSSLTGGADAVVPRTEGGYHPLCAAYTRACQPAVVWRLAEGRLAVTGLLDDVRTQVVTSREIAAFGDPARLLANVNDEATVAEIEVLLGHEP